VFSVGAAPRLYNEDLRQLRELRESLELAVAAENWIKSSGLGSWQMTEESR
jgi:hypothetical protein